MSNPEKGDKKEDIKVFTIEEANGLIPKLTEWFKELHAKGEELSSLEVEIDSLELIAKNPEGPSKDLSDKLDQYNNAVDNFYAIIDKIHKEGCYIKDVNAGLIDFYAVENEEVVYLCWRLGEEKINFWHEVGKGFKDRQPIHSREDN